MTRKCTVRSISIVNKPGITAFKPFFFVLNSESIFVFVLKPQIASNNLYGIEQSLPLVVVDF